MNDLSEEEVLAVLASQGLAVLPEDIFEVTARVNALISGVIRVTSEPNLLQAEPWPVPFHWRSTDEA